MSETPQNSTLFVKRQYDDKPPKKKRTWLRIVIYLLVACLLAGGIWAVVSLLPDKDTDAESDSLLFTEALSLNAADVKSITVQNEAPFTLLAVTKTDGGKTSTEWKLDGADENVTDLSAIKTFAENFISIQSLRTMTGTAGDYGFPEDGSGVVIEMLNGTKHTLQFGTESMDAIGNYMILDDSTVFVVDTAVAMQSTYSASDFAVMDVVTGLSTEDYSEYVTGSAITGFDRLEITLKGKPTTVITAKKIDSAFTYNIESPKSADLTLDDVQPVLSILQNGLTADSLYCYGIADGLTYEQFKEKAYATVSLRLGSTEIELCLSQKADNNYRLVCKGKNATYLFSEASLSSILDLA